METLPPAGSISSSEDHSISSVDLNKKRKLHYELISQDSTPSSPKQRFRTNAFGPGFLPNRRSFHPEEQPEKSENDSNSFVEANENSIESTIHRNPSPSISRSTRYVKSFSSHLDSLESRGIDEGINASASANLEDTLQFDPRDEFMEDILGLDHAELELSSEAAANTETMSLYSDNLPSHSLLLASGRWNLGQGAPLEARRLTIDQEFEQYFSSLML